MVDDSLDDGQILRNCAEELGGVDEVADALEVGIGARANHLGRLQLFSALVVAAFLFQILVFLVRFVCGRQGSTQVE